jgi:RNA polymerase sigma factor (sigma-70 family)
VSFKHLKTWHQGTPTVEETIQQWDKFIWQNVRKIFPQVEDQPDAYQEVCLRLCTVEPELRKFNSYVCKTIINTVYKHYRQHNTYADASCYSDQFKELVSDSGETEQVDYEGRPDTGLHARIALAQLVEDLPKDLRPVYRQLLDLLIQGYTLDEISEKMGRSRAWAGYMLKKLNGYKWLRVHKLACP